MLYWVMQNEIRSSAPARCPAHFSNTQREEAVHLYESGVLNGVQLARRYGVHRDVIYRHLKSVGAVKGRLVHQTTRKLEAELDARQLQRQLAKWKAEEPRLDALIQGGAVVEQFMKALLQADREGRLVEFGRLLPKVRST